MASTGRVDGAVTVEQPEGHRAVEPMPAEEELEAFYRDVYFQTVPTSAYSHSYSADELAQRRLRAEMLVRTAIAHLDASVLARDVVQFFDIGFGEGFELATAAKAGLAVAGVDYTLDAVRRLHPGLEAHVTEGNPLRVLGAMATAGEMHDIIVLRNVLEHVREPHTLLEAAAAVLSPGGVIAVTVPNDFTALHADIMARGFVDRDYWVAAPQHLQYFRADRFGAFAESCDLRLADLLGDFPIEIFLYHPGSNYIRDPELGPAAHRARVLIDLLCGQHGIERFSAFCRASAAVGLARAFTAFLTHQRG